MGTVGHLYSKHYPSVIPGFVAYLIKDNTLNDLCGKTLGILTNLDYLTSPQDNFSSVPNVSWDPLNANQSCPKIIWYGLCDNAWFPWQPLLGFFSRDQITNWKIRLNIFQRFKGIMSQFLYIIELIHAFLCKIKRFPCIQLK